MTTVDRTLLAAIWLMLLAQSAHGTLAVVAFWAACIMAIIALVMDVAGRRG